MPGSDPSGECTPSLCMDGISVGELLVGRWRCVEGSWMVPCWKVLLEGSLLGRKGGLGARVKVVGRACGGGSCMRGRGASMRSGGGHECRGGTCMNGGEGGKHARGGGGA